MALDTLPKVTHTVPADQPHSVYQIAARLFPAYTVDSGTVRLAGCFLDDRLFVEVRLDGEPPRTVYLDAAGQATAPDVVQSLGLENVRPVANPPRHCEAELTPLLDAAERMSAGSLSGGAVLATTAIWAKFAEGKLRFTIGENSVDLAFGQWARTLQPPPFVCPHSHRETFHLAATSDGRIVAAEAIATCQQTGRRVLDSELVACAATGQRVLAELTTVCPVTSQRVLTTVLTPCSACQQLVSPTALEQGECLACRRLASVDKDDPRMARLLHEHPDWERWGSWRLSETANAYILTAARWLKRILFVVDRQTLELRALSLGSRVFGGWEPVPADQRALVLSE